MSGADNRPPNTKITAPNVPTSGQTVTAIRAPGVQVEPGHLAHRCPEASAGEYLAALLWTLGDTVGERVLQKLIHRALVHGLPDGQPIKVPLWMPQPDAADFHMSEQPEIPSLVEKMAKAMHLSYLSVAYSQTQGNDPMRIELSPLEARVIGSLLEKENTTPEQYPLSLNALTAACNQKSNREPVMHLKETQVQDLLDGLKKKHLVSDQTGFGSRVSKYHHRFCNTGFGGFEFSPQELGLLCVLLLRGPQTPGELRGRAQRLCNFADVREVETVLQGLMDRQDGPFVARLARQPGRRESRYVHLFSDQTSAFEEQGAAEGPEENAQPLNQLVLQLRAELDELKARVDRLEGME